MAASSPSEHCPSSYSSSAPAGPCPSLLRDTITPPSPQFRAHTTSPLSRVGMARRLLRLGGPRQWPAQQEQVPPVHHHAPLQPLQTPSPSLSTGGSVGPMHLARCTTSPHVLHAVAGSEVIADDVPSLRRQATEACALPRRFPAVQRQPPRARGLGALLSSELWALACADGTEKIVEVLLREHRSDESSYAAARVPRFDQEEVKCALTSLSVDQLTLLLSLVEGDRREEEQPRSAEDSSPGVNPLCNQASLAPALWNVLFEQGTLQGGMASMGKDHHRNVMSTGRRSRKAGITEVSGQLGLQEGLPEEDQQAIEERHAQARSHPLLVASTAGTGKTDVLQRWSAITSASSLQHGLGKKRSSAQAGLDDGSRQTSPYHIHNKSLSCSSAAQQEQPKWQEGVFPPAARASRKVSPDFWTVAKWSPERKWGFVG